MSAAKSTVAVARCSRQKNGRRRIANRSESSADLFRRDISTTEKRTSVGCLRLSIEP
jgi:hypothetical protein